MNVEKFVNDQNIERRGSPMPEIEVASLRVPPCLNRGRDQNTGADLAERIAHFAVVSVRY